MTRQIILLAAFFVTLTSQSIQAGVLVEREYRGLAGLINFDPGTGFEWLDVNHTRNQSKIEVLARLNDPNDYLKTDGWRYAKQTELQALFDSQMLKDFSTDLNVITATRNFNIVLGATIIDDFTSAIEGFLSENSSGTESFVGLSVESALDPRLAISMVSSVQYLDTKEDRIGSFLVRTAPEPSSVVIWLLVGTAGLARFRRRTSRPA
jgi:hypothetical protein